MDWTYRLLASIGVIIFLLSIYKLIWIYIFKKINKLQNEDKLFEHQIKSFIDTYINNAISSIMFLFIIWTQGILIILKDSFLLPYYILTFTYFLTTALINALFIYSFTEIKHISPMDSIGIKILLLDKKSKGKAKRYYITTSLCGGLGVLAIIIQSCTIGIAYTLCLVIINSLVFILGMGDILQHNNYNCKEYRKLRRNMPIYEQYFINNIIKLYNDREYMLNAKMICIENCKNISFGIKNIFI